MGKGMRRGDCGERDAGMRRGLWGNGCRDGDKERGLWGKGCRDEEGTVGEGMQG